MEIGSRKLLWGCFCITLVLMFFAVSVTESRILVDRRQNLTIFRQQLIQVNGGITSTKVIIGEKHTYMSSKRYIPGGPDPRHH